MLEQIAQIMNPLPPLQTRKSLWLAFVLGFLFSGIALGGLLPKLGRSYRPDRHLARVDRHLRRRGVSGRVRSWEGCGGFSGPSMPMRG
jgi:hypothetical protein